MFIAGWQMVMAGQERPPAPAPRYLQQHAEPRDALKGQQQEGRQREPLTLGEALQPAQLRGEAHVRVPAEAAQAAGVGLEAPVPPLYPGLPHRCDLAPAMELT